MADVVCDTSPLQYLYQAGLLYVLPAIFDRVMVPPAVVAEIVEGRKRNVPLPEPSELAWVTIREVGDRTLIPRIASLGDGEREVIALGLEAKDSLLVIDDRIARRHAVAVGLRITGTLGVLLLAKERGHLGAVRPALDRLEAMRFRLSMETRRAVLDEAGEGS